MGKIMNILIGQNQCLVAAMITCVSFAFELCQEAAFLNKVCITTNQRPIQYQSDLIIHQKRVLEKFVVVIILKERTKVGQKRRIKGRKNFGAKRSMRTRKSY